MNFHERAKGLFEVLEQNRGMEEQEFKHRLSETFGFASIKCQEFRDLYREATKAMSVGSGFQGDFECIVSFFLGKVIVSGRTKIIG